MEQCFNFAWYLASWQRNMTIEGLGLTVSHFVSYNFCEVILFTLVKIKISQVRVVVLT